MLREAMTSTHSRNVLTMRKVMLFMIAALTILELGCQGPATLWLEQSRSPDGLWLATARGQQWSGPGNAYEATLVYLKWVKGSQPPIQILGFSDQDATTVHVKMEWVTPRHLNVIYAPSSGPNDSVNVDFQAIKCADVEITIQKLSTEAFNALR